MRVQRSQGVKIDVCQTCKGIWLDTMELQDLLKGVEGAPVKGPAPEITVPETTGEMTCPHCSLGLVPFEYAGDSGIELDRCPKCQGLWLDAGEWETIERKVGVARWKPAGRADENMIKSARQREWLSALVKKLTKLVKPGWGRRGY
jgi:Zn-finger nucleic acid-binding protein